MDLVPQLENVHVKDKTTPLVLLLKDALNEHGVALIG
ncbi:hypothetical protein PC120_g23706 [Phytophthora cactorum]|nr:hypothetical protein PC120_g23706 [Phytophthora cactorum]